MKLIVTSAALAVVGAVALYLTLEGSDAEPAQTPALTVAQPAIPSEGEELYQSFCAACHGVNLEGQANWRERGPDGRMPAPPHDETGHTWHHDRATLFNLTKYGVAELIGDPDYPTDMPGFRGVLNDQEINEVLDYIQSQWPDDIRVPYEAREAGG